MVEGRLTVLITNIVSKTIESQHNTAQLLGLSFALGRFFTSGVL